MSDMLEWLEQNPEPSALNVLDRMQELEQRAQRAQNHANGLEAAHKEVVKLADEANERVSVLTRIIADQQMAMCQWAQRLARAGEYDHKGKNEVLLRVIADLLATATRRYDADIDEDVPF